MKLQRKIRGIDDKDAVIPDKLDVPQTCLTCSEKFEDFYHLRIHIMGSGHEQIVKEETGFTCFTCDSNFVKFADLELHMYMTAHHGNPMRTGERKIEMVDHFTENRKCPYRCSLCLRTFQKQEYIENHIKAGDCIMRWRHKCPCCDLNFYSRNLYEAHMYQCHHYEFPFKCEHKECSGLEFKKGYSMHRKSHANIAKRFTSNKKKFKCQICDRMFINYARFSAHRKKEHPPTGSNGYKCQICGKIFFSNAALKRHTKVHAATGSILHRVIEESKEETIYRCFSCDTFYKNKPDLTLHMKQTNHHGLPEQEKDIHLESVINDGREITRCSRCLFVFKTLKKAKLHIRSATCKITFQKKCPLCKTSFFSLNLYEVHLKEKCSSHSGTNGLDEELICEQCGFQTLRRRELNTHMRQKHGQKSRAKTSKILAPKRKRSKTAKKMTYQSSEDETTSESEEANKPEDLDTIIDEDVITSKSEDREPEDLDAVKDSEDQIAGTSDETTSESENKELEDLDTVKDVKDQLGDTNLQDFSNHSEEEGQENSMDLLDLSPEFASESEQLLFDLLL
ncbi:hypothetical protein FSP39_018064 [Pinctada imbricata]|uniref:C2H2-type domain-containing protein n=1 Tax=Pinctada imbricata TaxID=66713 RepID=A0AA88Y8E4_PINIB|nr:hypothetical protein FSP39_018064 [Pinctada imbricata]